MKGSGAAPGSPGNGPAKGDASRLRLLALPAKLSGAAPFLSFLNRENIAPAVLRCSMLLPSAEISKPACSRYAGATEVRPADWPQIAAPPAGAATGAAFTAAALAAAGGTAATGAGGARARYAAASSGKATAACRRSSSRNDLPPGSASHFRRTGRLACCITARKQAPEGPRATRRNCVRQCLPRRITWARQRDI